MDKCGSMTVSEKGSKEFGSWELSWEITMDGAEWELRHIRFGREEEPDLNGFLKYKGWNRAVKSMPDDEPQYRYFECYVHDWEDYKKAMDYLYYKIGYRISERTGYQDSFKSVMRKVLE